VAKGFYALHQLVMAIPFPHPVDVLDDHPARLHCPDPWNDADCSLTALLQARFCTTGNRVRGALWRGQKDIRPVFRPKFTRRNALDLLSKNVRVREVGLVSPRGEIPGVESKKRNAAAPHRPARAKTCTTEQINESCHSSIP